MTKLNLNNGTTEHCETEFYPCGSKIPWFGDLDPEVDPMSNETNTPYMAVKSKMAAIDPFEGIYAVVMRAYINNWSLNDAYYATEVRIKSN